MDKSALIETATTIRPPSPEAGRAMEEHGRTMTNKLNQAMLNKKNLDVVIGQGNRSLMATNHTNHVRYISSLASLYDPTSLVETVIWVFRTYRSHGFTPDYWRVMLPEATAILHAELDEPFFKEVRPIYDWLYENIDNFVLLSDQEHSFYEELGTMQGLLHDDG